MFLSVKEMELRKIRFDESFDAAEMEFAAENLEQTIPLHAVGTAELLKNSGGQIRIQGRYTVELTAPCDRCLAVARYPMDAGFDLFYKPATVIQRTEEVEIDEGEAQIGFYENGGLELEEVLREQVLLALPMQRVCSEDCKGICPVCGKNRNEAECGCRVENHDHRLGALRNLKI
jgi:uncharacterized protein